MATHLGKLFKQIRFQIGLGLLTTFLVAAIIPAVAQSDSRLEWRNYSARIEQRGISPATPTHLLNRGRQSYDRGRFLEATTMLRQAALEFGQAGNVAGQAQSLSSLSLAYQALGDWERAEGAISHSLLLTRQLQKASLRGQALEVRGQLQQEKSQTQAALASWQQAEATYRQAGDRAALASNQIKQVRALQTLGQYDSAKEQLKTAYVELIAQPNTLSKAQSLHEVGILLQGIGSLPMQEQGTTVESIAVLQQGLSVARQLDERDAIAEILLSLGNTTQEMQQPAQAFIYYQQAAAIAQDAQIRLAAQLNQLSLAITQREWQRAILLLPAIQAQRADLPASRQGAIAAVQLVEALSQLGKTLSPTYLETAAQVATNALHQGQRLQDWKAEALALKALGSLYEQTTQYAEALELTKQSLQIAQKMSAREIEARAWRQLGRLRQQLGDTPGAIAAYRQAFDLLETLRRELIADPQGRLFFSQTLEPTYRELVSLLLESPDESSLENLRESRRIIESLQQAELEGFFRQSSAAVTAPAAIESIDAMDATAAVIYPIILRDRLEVILSLPGQPPRHYATSIAQGEVIRLLDQMRQSLRITVPRQERLRLFQQAYDWLIRPGQAALAEQNIKTLVFVLDSDFRRIPMTVLHDGRQYLLEKYSVAIAQSLQVMPSPPGKSPQRQALTAGLSEARQGFTPLPGVKTELSAIAATLNTRTLLDGDFTHQNLQAAINSTSTPPAIVHLATHGQFGSSAEDTFILTWDERVNVRELDSLLAGRNGDNTRPIELLVLSACQTAKGDRNSLLGLAGVAVRSGARSILATLWSVRDDPTTQLMGEFYRQLAQPNVTKAEALRQAQLQLLKGNYKHPLYWAPFVLVGNWQ